MILIEKLLNLTKLQANQVLQKITNFDMQFTENIPKLC